MYRGTRLTAELTAQQSSEVYPYVFTHRGGFFSFANYLGLYGRGPTHADDLQYQFPSLTKHKSWPDLFHEMDIEFSKKFVKLWVSFAASGKPTETWGMDWEAANVANQPLGTELPWYSIHQRPKLFKFSQEYEDKFVKMDTLYSKYEKPQRSWRASKSLKKEEL
jgi:carboxylesterase type B